MQQGEAGLQIELAINVRVSDYFPLLSFLRVLRNDAKAQLLVGLFRYWGRCIILDVFIVSVNQKKTVRTD